VPASIQVATCTGWIGADRRHAHTRAPGQKFIGSAGVRPARVRVADVGREEFEEAHAGALAGGGDERGQSRRAERDELVHEMITAGKYSKPAAIDA
jgi:hypothetical protein